MDDARDLGARDVGVEVLLAAALAGGRVDEREEQLLDC
jgi:hypothetical protein